LWKRLRKPAAPVHLAQVERIKKKGAECVHDRYFPVLVVVSLVMDLVGLGPKQLESPFPHGKDRTHHS